MRIICSLIVMFFITVMAAAQKIHIPLYISYSTYPINVDGYPESAWDAVDDHRLEVDGGGDRAYTLYEAWFKMLWNDTSLIMYVVVDDDNHCDQWCTGLEDWQSDRLEIFLDVNDTLDDGLGTSDGPETGHYQFTSPWFKNVNDTAFNYTYAGNSITYQCGYTIDIIYFEYEFAWKWSELTDCNDEAFVAQNCNVFGLQVKMVDADSDNPDSVAFCQLVEGNAWENMDSMGVITLAYSESGWPCREGISNTSITNLKVYPNPAEDYIVIVTEPGLITEVKIYNVIGQEILNIKNYDCSRIDVSGLGNGLYYIGVYDKNDAIYGRNKFIVIR